MAGPQPWVAGPTTLFINGQELGTAERYPRFSIRSGFVPYFNDITGPVVPNDMLWAGKEAFIFADMNRWDEKVLELFRTITLKSKALSWDEDDVGSLMIHEGHAAEIRLDFPYAVKPKYAGMPKGYTFKAGWYEGPEEFGTLGTNPQKVHVVIHCLPVLVGRTWILGEEK